MSTMSTLITPYTIERMPRSSMGNPRYKLVDPEGRIIGTTRPNSSLALGPVSAHAAGGPCRIVVHVTRSGRRYIDSVTPA